MKPRAAELDASLVRRYLADAFVFGRRALRRVKMWLLGPAFKRHGRNLFFDPDGSYTYHTIELGNDVILSFGVKLVASDSSIVIGDKVMIGPEVMIIAGDHNTSVVGQAMYDVRVKRPQDDQAVIIEDDVWVGAGAIILKGVTLGRGCIVAAGSLVNKPVPPYAVVAGVPATVRKTRFDIMTIMAHEATLYPPEKRLSEECLATALGEFSFDHRPSML